MGRERQINMLYVCIVHVMSSCMAGLCPSLYMGKGQKLWGGEAEGEVDLSLICMACCVRVRTCDSMWICSGAHVSATWWHLRSSKLSDRHMSIMGKYSPMNYLKCCWPTLLLNFVLLESLHLYLEHFSPNSIQGGGKKKSLELTVWGANMV